MYYILKKHRNQTKIRKTKNIFFYNLFLYFFIIITIITYLTKLQIFDIVYLSFNNKENFIESIKIILYTFINQTFYFFTSQSNFLVIIVLILNLTKFKKNKYYPILAFIVLIDILLTGIVWNLIAAPTNELKEITDNFFTISLFQHFYIPILYTIFYFYHYVDFNSFFTLRKAYYALIHPLFYLFYSLLLGYFSKEKLYPYPYNFVNPNEKCVLSETFFIFFKINNYKEKQGFLGVFINNIFLLIVLIFCILFLYILYKKIKSKK
ncbi:putative membrane protein [Candidatus Phytoplasma oryzae]|uniref:Putative membrane protein n=1 Tax=Candidatus Phytoplasma oryzae TaxID=203274 RepID=A0A139JQE9_9MOLU|nr:hypothetical protein [Candidatus Phytoplasma oryzae]KXT29106.1 putative membrane protein [Candidatus Phytoplasma oryzae]KXT29150.1 putative membrane protein [Candidatus Phytoplasma oryzae]RAM57911.1 hypothetical protein DH96_01230 [Candidatus Phytoplasma oryzae]